ncbi:MAG: hypothetical protein IH596_13275 [Bacteroidales bacterium]|nr:hypothetical protein [Bacteroidales bacterium]
MQKGLILCSLVFFLLTHVLIPGHAHEQRDIDSLRTLINLPNATDAQKTRWLFKIADLFYYSDQTKELHEVILEAKGIVDHLNDKCLEADLGVFEAKYLFDSEMFHESRRRSMKVLAFARLNRCVIAEIDILLHLGKQCMYFSEEDSTFFYLQQAKRIAEESGDVYSIAKVNRMLGLHYFVVNQFQRSRELLQPSYHVFLQHRDFLLAGKTLSDISECFYTESNYDSALVYALNADTILQKSSGFYDLANNYNLMALIYHSTGPIEEAIIAYFNGLRIADQYNNTELQILFLYNLANCYYDLNALDKATERFRLCLTRAVQVHDTSTIIYSLSALGNLALEDSNYDTAYLYLMKSYNLALQTNESDMLSFLAASLADLKIELKEYGEAQKYIDKAFEYAKEVNSPEEMISISISQAMFYAETNRFNESIELLFNVLDQSKKIKSVDGYRLSLESLAEVYEKQTDYKNSLIYYQKVHEFEDSIQLTSTLEKFISTEWQFEKDKADRIKQLEIENADLIYQANLRETRLIALIAIITTIALLAVSLFLYLLSRSRKNRARVLQDKNRLIKGYSDELMNMVSRQTAMTEQLEVANLAKSKLFSIIGHDVKTPLNIIQGYIDLLMTDSPDADTREIYYKSIAKASEQLIDMINTLLDWAREQSGTIQYSPELFNVVNLINHLLTSAEIQATRKQIEIRKEYDPNEEIMIHADKLMFERILYNLLTNAIKFTPNHGKVSVGWTFGKDQVKFFVKDTGIGMTEEMTETIFEKSMESIRKGTDGEKGSGLGLNICREFVKKHHGHIWAESSLGSGTQIYFNIPLTLRE